MSLTPELSIEALILASQAIESYVYKTPVLTSRTANELTEAEIFFKCENLQKSGSFKIRGAYYALSLFTNEERERGVIAFSSGNHGQAIALAAKDLGIPAIVVMPKDAPKMKIEATRSYGAEIILYDRLTEDRESIANEILLKRGGKIIPPYNHHDVIAGQGSVAIELLKEVGKLDYLFVCVGGGGLTAGSALAIHHLSPDCKVIGVEPEKGNDAQQSFAQKALVKIPVPQSIADGAQTQMLGTLTFPIIQKYVHAFHTVTDLEICRQMRFFMQKMKIIVEPTGCLSAAAVMNHKMDLKGARVGVIVSGGNTDIEKFHQYIEMGMT